MLSPQEQKLLASLDLFGPQQIERSDWREFERLEKAGYVELGPEIEGSDYRTVKRRDWRNALNND